MAITVAVEVLVQVEVVYSNGADSADIESGDGGRI